MEKNDYIYFYIPGLAYTFDINYMLITRLEEYPDHFYPNIKIGAVFGTLPGAIWNGGRLSQGMVEQEGIDRVFNYYAFKKIPIRWTWTNPILEKEDLDDNFCNYLTRRGEDGINEVLVSNDMMENYIRTNYPKYPIISSTTKRITDIKALNEELEKDYKLVVIDYDFNNKWELLDQIKHPEKCEILINAVCTPGCPNRKRHYQIIGSMQKNKDVIRDPEIENCPSQWRLMPDVKKLSTFISVESIWNDYVPRGFRHFKIEGREVCPLKPLEWYLYYLVKPEYQEEERAWLEFAFESCLCAPNVPVISFEDERE